MNLSKGNRLILQLGGIFITFSLIFLSGLSGWMIERIFLLYENDREILITIFFIFTLSSSLAAKSLFQSVIEIVNLISKENIESARKKLSYIDVRDVQNLEKNEGFKEQHLLKNIKFFNRGSIDSWKTKLSGE